MSNLSSSPSKNQVGLAFLIMGIFSYGWLWPVMRAGVEYLPPLWFAFIRVFLGFVVLMAVLAVQGKLKLPTRSDLPAILSVGICMMGLYVSLVHTAMDYIPAGRGALLGYLTPLFVTPVAIIFLKEKMTTIKGIGLLMGLGGLGFLFNPLDFNWRDNDAIFGSGLCLIAAISWSVAILQMRVHKWNLTPLQLGPWQLLLATLVTLPFAIFVEDTRQFDVNTQSTLLILYAGVFGTAIAMWSVANSIRSIGAVTTSIGLLGGPVVAISTSVLLLGEKLSISLITGLILILSGIVLVTWPSSKRK
ncbi:MAG: multidrug DMT transporter permease [Rhodospirillaceae bacterium]|nr:multidrug DMT transporter permease [Rhodospirillaceae bacterium]|tara:strand:+ start:2928 stop:3836 length:909 start_codon:yes stop_codon:yes gene_type:complete